MEAVPTSLFLKHENLPPTERAIFFHALRVHLQVAQWKLMNVNCLNPLEWGRKTIDAGLEPVKTDLDTAPENLLQFMCCKCKLSSKNPCSTRLCSCFRSGLQCVPTCGDCRGESCENSVKVKDAKNEEGWYRNILDTFN